MAPVTTGDILTYTQRIDLLRAEKMRQTAEKQQVVGAMDYDDWALVLPPPELRKVVETISGSGIPIKDCMLSNFTPEPNHPSGGFFGPVAVGGNFRRLLEAHPVYLDAANSLAGAYMVNFLSYRTVHWNPDYSYDELKPDQQRYRIMHGIGGVQHFSQDLAIGLELGWVGIAAKIARGREANRGPRQTAFYEGLEQVLLGLQDWIGRHAAAAEDLARTEQRPGLAQNLREIAVINRRLVTEPPATFREACQWILWHLLAARMYDGSGSVGRLDNFLLPFYERDHAAGTLEDEEAVFHLACLLVRDTGYMQLGGYDEAGRDDTNPVSFLILDAIDQLRLPANIGVSVGKGIDRRLLTRGVAMQFANRNGIPKFLGVDRTAEGFARNGYPLVLGHQRVYTGCHWSAIPGREYTMNDISKLHLGAIFDVAIRDLMAKEPGAASTELLFSYFHRHLARAVDVLARGFDVHMRHMGEVFPELVIDLLCHGTIEKGLDAAAGGVEFVDLCVDGAALATVADSFAAIEQRIEREHRLTWDALLGYLDSDWAGSDGERLRQLMKSSARFGSGGSMADRWASRVADTFTSLTGGKRTPDGWLMVPGFFSWALVYAMGRELGATPNGRRSGDPISHGPNPHPGFRRDGAATALAAAVAGIQPGWGNTAPLQMDIDPMVIKGADSPGIVESLIATHFELGGTQINLNVVDAATVLEAYDDPSKHPDLVVRVTGFSAFFSSLSPEMRKFVVDRMIRDGA
jgi:pyruvate-formate lyase